VAGPVLKAQQLHQNAAAFAGTQAAALKLPGVTPGNALSGFPAAPHAVFAVVII